MKLRALSHGTGTIASAPGKGAAFALDTNVVAEIKLLEDEKEIIYAGGQSSLVKKIAKKTLDFFGYDYGAEISIESEIPAGMDDSGAISTAIALAIAGGLAKSHGSINELRIDKYMHEQFLVVDKKVVDKKKLIELCTPINKNQFDDVSASFYGGFVITDNKKREILRRGEMEDLYAIILIPKETAGIDMAAKDLSTIFTNEAEIAWNEALRGDLYTAMKLNTLIHGNGSAREMLSSGALTTSISHSSIIGLVRDEDNVEPVADAVRGNGEVLVRKVTNEGAKILEKPKKVMRVREFLKLKGEGEFHYL